MKIPMMKQIKKNYLASQTGSGMKRMKGRGWWDSVGNWFKQAGVDADAWLKKTGAISKLGTAVSALSLIPGFQEFLPVAAGIKGVAGLTGYGRKRKFRGGDSRLSINPFGQRMTGKMTIASNGSYQAIPVVGKSGMIGKGNGFEFGSVSSAFSKVKF